MTETSTGNYQKIQFSGYLLPIMGGATFLAELPGLPLSVGGGAYLGYGIAGSSEKYSINFGSPDSTEALMGGGGLVADLNLNANMNFGPVSGGLLLGYRIANIAEMKALADNADMGIKKGDVAEGSDGKAIPFDYSGFVVGLNISMGF